MPVPMTEEQFREIIRRKYTETIGPLNTHMPFAGLRIAYGIMPVVFRFGTNPTGIRVPFCADF